jgi:protein-L-isoaspartate(D-aspartate) O-methyltransferase
MNKSQLLQSLKQQGFSVEILDAFSKVPREDFIPAQLKSRAYEDTALPIGKSQTISQPYTIAVMLSLLELQKSQKVLEVGSGCGYVLALLSELVRDKGQVFGIEIIKELAEKSKQNLKNYKNVKVYNKNGADGLKEKAPFSKILISAGCREIPKKLLSQLKNNGILVAPVGPSYEQSLVAIQKKKNKFIIKKKIPGFIFVRFVE